jgi:POT family proton-dependent oligopeptide transporter
MVMPKAEKKTRSFLGFPGQIGYIMGNEACERFSFYGMRSILVIFMTKYLLMPEHHSKAVYHFFIMGCYFLPLLGGYLSDRFLGKYRAILYLSLFYCAGHAVLAMVDSKVGMYWGLGLIAFGCGGIKPCVSAFVGDQFGRSNQHLVSKVYDLFYFTINLGSILSTILIPWLLPNYGPRIAFGLPGVLMFIATVIFWLGRKHYIVVPPAGKKDASNFLPILWHGLTKPSKGKSWLDSAKEKYGAEKVDGVKAVLGCAAVFSSVAVFWALWDQQGSSWILQADQMDLVVFGVPLLASQIQTLNPILVLMLIPFCSYVLYPAIEKMGIKVTPLRKMGAGLLGTGLSFAMVGAIQLFLDSGVKLNVSWQFMPFLVITAAEVLVSIPGLEFAYTQAPKSMKGTMMSLWLLTTAVGNLLTASISELNPFKTAASEFFFYGGLVFVVAFAFIYIAMHYKERNFVAST